VSESTYDEGSHAEKYAESKFLPEWQRERVDHRNGEADDEEIAADVEGCLHNGKVLECGALWVWRRDRPVSSKWAASSKERNLNSDPACYDPRGNKLDPFAVSCPSNHAREHEEHACFECPDNVEHALRADQPRLAQIQAIKDDIPVQRR
jgi:hypothetical protein